MKRTSILLSHIAPLSASALTNGSMEVKLTRDTINSSVAILELNRPKSLNNLTISLADAFEKAVHEISQDRTIRCVVLTGAGKAFSAGGDLDWLKTRTTEKYPNNNTEVMAKFYNRFLQVRNIPVPVVSYINGAAIGAGFCLALATDIRVAEAGAKMGLNFLRLGIHPGMGVTHTLHQIVGTQTAAEMILTARLISGKEAKEKGIVAAAVEGDAAAREYTLNLARMIASNAPSAVRSYTRTLRNTVGNGLDQALLREADAQATSYASPELHIGLEAVRAKKDPVFPDTTAPPGDT